MLLLAVYLDYGSSDRITLSVATDGTTDSSSRNWNVKVSYIECSSRARGEHVLDINSNSKWIQA